MIKIGDKVKGFKFGDDAEVNYVPAMDKYVGKSGKVCSIYENSVQISFDEDDKKWYYPISEYITIQRETKLKQIGI